MSIPTSIDVANLYHAYLIEDTGGVFESLPEVLRDGYKDAEIYVQNFDLLGIDDSRNLVRLANMRSLGVQLFVWRVEKCTREAQNALLKLLEEPPERSHFFFCVSGVQDILPTLRSRAWVIQGDKNSKEVEVARDFIKGNPSRRVAILEPIIKEKDRQSARRLLDGIEGELYACSAISSKRALQHIIDVRRVMQDNGASLKQMLESVALVTPKLS